MKLNKINLLIIQNQKRHQATQGFLLIEVMVGILLTLLLTGISMGVVVMATAIKVRGDELSDATRWIQEDIEDIKIVANKLDAADSTASTMEYNVLTKCNATGTSNGYANLLMNPSTTPATTFLNGGTTILATNTFTKTSPSGSRSYSLIRTAAVKNVSPYNVLTLTYSVTNASSTVISSAYTEIIPGASFYCK